MSESLTMLSETADRLFADLNGRPFDEAWAEIEAAGFPLLLLGEDEGGFGGDWQDAFAVARLSALHALDLPVADAVLATALTAKAGLALPEGRAALASGHNGQVTDGRFSGWLTGLPWGRSATTALAAIDGELVALSVSDAVEIVEGENPAGEARDRLRFDNAAISFANLPVDAFELGAFLRTAQIAGALDAALGMSIAYANERQQFGKPISKFQAVQQGLAVFAEEAAAVNSAGQAAARALDAGDGSFEVLAAKLRANAASGVGAATAHQVHGAIGFTHESRLHHFTRRLHAWRAEYGADRKLARLLGERVAAAGADAFWPMLAARSDRITA